MEVLMESHTTSALLFYLILLIMFSKGKKLNLLTTRIFHALIVSTNINFILNIMIFYGYFYRSVVDYNVLVCLTKLYLISSVFILEIHCLYLKKMCVRSFYLSKLELFLHFFFAFIYAILTFSTQLTLVFTDRVVNFEGLCVRLSYVFIGFYMLIMFIFAIKYWDEFSEKIKATLIICGCTISATFLTQIMFDYFLDYVSTCYSMLMLAYFLCFENANDLIDDKTGMFNKTGFIKLAEEYMKSKTPFIAVNVELENLEYVRYQFGADTVNEILMHMNQYISKLMHMNVFINKEHDMLILLLEDEKSLERLNNLPEEYLAQAWNIQDTKIIIEARINILQSKYIKNIKEIFDLFDYIQKMRGYYKSNKPILIDDTIIQRQERETKIKMILNAALINDGFEVYYQPIYHVGVDKYTAAEALVRLKDTETVGFVSPEDFIPIAEKNGMIMLLGSIVFEKVCKFCSDNLLWEKGMECIEVNLSAIQAVDHDLSSQLSGIIKKYNVPPNFINLEVTETAAIHSPKNLRNNMTTLKSMGCTFSMDDFGTGYSNLAQIAELGYDVIKLDKSLVWPCFAENGEKSKIILKNIINMIHELGIRIIVEGIETQDQSDFLKKLGVNHHQGYFYSKPIRANDFINLMEL